MNVRWLHAAIGCQFLGMFVLGLKDPSNFAFVTLFCTGSSTILMILGLEKLTRSDHQDGDSNE